MENKSKHNQKIRLSIVMPFYNHKNLVEEMIDSIVANDFQDWELLAIDDGSDQDTISLFNKYECDHRIKIIPRKREPKGAQTCRNIGLELAQGDYIVFFDSDDFVESFCLTQRVKTMDMHPEVDVAIFPSAIYTNGAIHPEASQNVYGYHIFKDDIESFASKELPYIVWNNIYRKASLLNTHIQWDEELLSLQDSDFNLQVLLSGMNIMYASSSKPDYAYRIENKGLSVSKKIHSAAHLQSHLHHLRKDIKSIQAKYGHAYDKALHDGVLFIYNRTMSEGNNRIYAKQLLELEKECSMSTYNRFKRLVMLHEVLACLLPAKRARQFSMLSYLLRKRRNCKKKITMLKQVIQTNSF